MSLHKNRVKMTSATTGTGPLTLGSASSGYQSFATAYGADATVDILITEGTAWEVARDCAYTNSGTTVSRGTLEASSTGIAVNFGGTQVVSVIATAGAGQQTALNHVAITDADVPMVVGSMYVGSIAGFTADRTYTLPASANVGDRIGIMLTAGDDLYELIIKPDASDTLNGGSAGAEWSRLFITNEAVIMRCVTANSAWVVEQDGRIPMSSLLILTTASDGTETGATFYAPATSQGAAWTPQFDVGNIATVATDKFTARRACKASISAAAYPRVAVADTKYVNVIVSKTPGTPTLELYARNFASVGSFTGAIVAGVLSLAAGESVTYMYRFEENNIGSTAASATSNTVFYSFAEVL